MSPAPRAHVYLKEAFLFADRQRLHLHGGRSLRLGKGEAAVLACLERGESELGVLARSLAELEIGGDAAEIERKLVELYSSPASVLEIGPPQDVVAPEVIVCSFSPERRWSGSDELVRRLRRTGLAVLHLGTKEHVRGDPRANRALEPAVASGSFRSSFQFLQWTRSLIRFHARAVLVLTGTQDTLLFGDLAARNPSVVCLGHDWPPAVRVQDLLGAAGILRDPLASLRSLFFAMRMTVPKDFARLEYSGSSELSALALYGLRGATVVAYSLADQPAELARLGRTPRSMLPLCTGIARGATATDAPRSGAIAVVLDFEHVPLAVGPLQLLLRALAGTALTEVVLRAGGRWFDVLDRSDHLAVVARDAAHEAPRPAAALLFPGLLRDLQPALELLALGIPTLCYPSEQPHPLLEHAGEEWRSIPPDEDGWRATIAEILDERSARRAALLATARRCLRAWDLTRRVRALVPRASAAERERETVPESEVPPNL